MLIDRQLKTAKPKEKEYELHDGQGLHVRIKPNGKKQFFHRYSFGGKQRRKIIGNYPDINLAEAREIHQEQRKILARGVDPIELEKDQSLEKHLQPSVEEFAREYYERYLVKELKAPEKPKYLLDKNVIPFIGDRKVADVTRRELIDLLDIVSDRGAPVQANRTLSAIRGLFTFACDRGVIDAMHNPTLGLTKKSAGGTETSRDRFLRQSEIKKLWEKLESPPFEYSMAVVLKVLLLTGLRVNEVLGARKAEIDYEKRIWSIPVARLKTTKKDKNRKPHKVMLTGFIIELLRDLEDLSGNSQYLVQSPRSRVEKPIVYDSLAQAVKRNRKHFKMKKWTPHDLRRTVSTHMNEIPEIEPYVVEKILDHKMQGVMAVYNKAEYLEQRKDAMEIWSERVKQIISGEKVVQLKKKA